MPPGKASHPLGAGAVCGDDEDAPGVLSFLPGIERVDQIEPDHGTTTDGSIFFAASASITSRSDWLEAYLDAPACRASIAAWAGVGSIAKRKVVYRMTRASVPSTCDTYEHAFEPRLRVLPGEHIDWLPFAPSHTSLLTLAVGVPAILLDRRL